MQNRKSAFLIGISCLGFCGIAAAKNLVLPETVATQKKLTFVEHLKNGTPVVIRDVPGSDILQVTVSFDFGLRDLDPGEKIAARWLWSTAQGGSKKFPKPEVYRLVEKYALDMGCKGNIEDSTCVLGTVNDYWKDALPLFASIVLEPSFASDVAQLEKQRLEAELQATPSEPSSYINEIINRIFYPVGHPYRLNHEDALVELKKLTPRRLASMHAEILRTVPMRIVVVGSMDHKTLLADLDKTFGQVVHASDFAKRQRKPVTPPPFKQEGALTFENRDIPTAYLAAKFSVPPMSDPDHVATTLLFQVLDEELSDEVRTKRSLSYSIHAGYIPYSIGIGVISASTSKPQETLDAIKEVIQRVKDKTYSDEELAEYKTIFTTEYFQTLETHASLAEALDTQQQYFGTPMGLYDLPEQLERVTPSDIKRLANSLLVNMRLGVLYSKDRYQEAWGKGFVAGLEKK